MRCFRVAVVRFEVSRLALGGVRDDEPGGRLRADDEAEYTGMPPLRSSVLYFIHAFILPFDS